MEWARAVLRSMIPNFGEESLFAMREKSFESARSDVLRAMRSDLNVNDVPDVNFEDLLRQLGRTPQPSIVPDSL